MAASKYHSHVKDRISTVLAWKRKGLTDKEIADNLGIGITALKKYKGKYEAFAAAIKGGKSDADSQVENALFKSAVGFSVAEKEVTTIDDPEKGITTRTKNNVKVYPPNVAAMIFYLKNRCSPHWQDRRQVGVGDLDGKPLENNVHFLLPDNGMDDGDGK